MEEHGPPHRILYETDLDMASIVLPLIDISYCLTVSDTSSEILPFYPSFVVTSARITFPRYSVAFCLTFSPVKRLSHFGHVTTSSLRDGPPKSQVCSLQSLMVATC